MKISEIIPYVLNEELEKEFFFSQWKYNNRKICIVKIICDNGLVGWGEAYGPAPVVRESINYCISNFEPRISVVSLQVFPNFSDNGFSVEMTYIIRGTDDPSIAVEFFLARTR